MRDDVQLGKGGLSEGFIATLQRLLAEQELVKLRFGKDVQGAAREDLAAEVVGAIPGEAVECVAIVGRTMLLYRANPELDPKRRALG